MDSEQEITVLDSLKKHNRDRLTVSFSYQIFITDAKCFVWPGSPNYPWYVTYQDKYLALLGETDD